MRKVIIFALLMCCCIPVDAQSDYYMQQARSYQREAEYYTKQAVSYGKDADYYNMAASSLSTVRARWSSTTA